MNPEFLTEGQAVRDFLDPDRIVIGGGDERTVEVLAGLYRAFERATWIRTNNRTAEMIKYASNALLATAISFANEIGNLCGAVGGVDVIDVMTGVHASYYLSPRVDGERVTAPIASFLWPGCGFGGSCLPKDVSAIAAYGRQRDVRMDLMESVLQVNERQYTQVLARLQKHFPSLEGVRVAVLGLAFKPDTDDMRESPAIPIVRELLAQRADVRAYDPAVDAATARRMLGVDVPLYAALEPAVREAQALVLVTRWDEFRRVPDLLRDVAPPPLVVDGRRMLDRSSVARYEGVGL
jgi:UDPglucose 6-dehydrogenase/GDP-mannose 6-dehydrogenase